MARGFFPSSTLVGTPPVHTIPQCGACGLYKTCQSPKMPPSGKGRRKIMLIAEAPGAEEDKQGVQLVGNSGKYVEKVLRGLGIDMRKDCVLTNSVICRPPGNTTPTGEQVSNCRPNLRKALEEHQPEVIIPLGYPSMQSILPLIWKGDTGQTMARWVGWTIPSQKLNAWVCPTYHPSFLLRSKDSVLDRLFEEHLSVAVDKDRRPWNTVPDFASRVERIVDPREAAARIRGYIEAGGDVAFDYETTTKKPEYPGAAIVSCSVCWRGKETIAYPWLGQAVKATREMLQSDRNGKIASNLKFEERWTLWAFGEPVNNWIWDTMLGAHWADNRSDITSIKFQSLVLLGDEGYEEKVKPFLKAKRGKTVNEILTEVDLSDLLLYNGLDSLLEYKVAQIQRKLLPEE